MRGGSKIPLHDFVLSLSERQRVNKRRNSSARPPAFRPVRMKSVLPSLRRILRTQPNDVYGPLAVRIHNSGQLAGRRHIFAGRVHHDGVVRKVLRASDNHHPAFWNRIRLNSDAEIIRSDGRQGKDGQGEAEQQTNPRQKFIHGDKPFARCDLRLHHQQIIHWKIFVILAQLHVAMIPRPIPAPRKMCIWAICWGYINIRRAADHRHRASRP